MPETTNRRRASRGWVLTGVALLALGLSAEWARYHGVAGFWTSYALDFAGPAWSYIALRALAGAHPRSRLWRRLTPGVTAVLIIGACFLIEGLQFLQVYDAHFDHWDLVAYPSGVLPLAAVDRWSAVRRSKGEPS